MFVLRYIMLILLWLFIVKLTYGQWMNPYGPHLRFGMNGMNNDPKNHPNWHMVDNPHCGSSLSDRIIGGVNATIGQYPWLARVGYNSKKKPRAPVMFRCGGSLINQCHVLTAAHCVTGLPPDLYVAGIRLGEFDSETDIDCDYRTCAEPVQDFYPVRILVHKDYGNPSFKNDIALIKLDRNVEYNSFVIPICLPSGLLLHKELRGSVAEVAGWGVYDLKVPTGSRLLQTVKLPIVERERCTDAFRRHAVVDDQQLCVGGIVGQDSCGGDSGGPLMKVDVLDGPPKYFQFGIVSFGAKYCGATVMPAVYTRVSSYIDWILNNLSFCY